MANLNIKAKNVLVRPRITEKAAIGADKNNVYVFEVDKNANKITIASSIKEVYKVKPIKVRVINSPAKEVFVRGKWGTKSGSKKAYVYLKKGDKIEII